jgi:hypothetical protein
MFLTCLFPFRFSAFVSCLFADYVSSRVHLPHLHATRPLYLSISHPRFLSFPHCMPSLHPPATASFAPFLPLTVALFSSQINHLREKSLAVVAEMG